MVKKACLIKKKVFFHCFRIGDCPENYFRCDNVNCIQPVYLCDQVPDCDNMSDEDPGRFFLPNDKTTCA